MAVKIVHSQIWKENWCHNVVGRNQTLTRDGRGSIPATHTWETGMWPVRLGGNRSLDFQCPMSVSHGKNPTLSSARQK